jgi:hypothetical protein
LRDSYPAIICWRCWRNAGCTAIAQDLAGTQRIRRTGFSREQACTPAASAASNLSPSRLKPVLRSPCLRDSYPQSSAGVAGGMPDVQQSAQDLAGTQRIRRTGFSREQACTPAASAASNLSLSRLKPVLRSPCLRDSYPAIICWRCWRNAGCTAESVGPASAGSKPAHPQHLRRQTSRPPG